MWGILNRIMQQDEETRSSTSGTSSRNSPYSRGVRSDSWTRDGRNSQSYVGRTRRHDSNGASMSFPRDRSAANDVKPTGKLTVENLHYEVSQSELQQLFEQIGPVVKAYIKFDRSGRSTGTAIIVYENPNHAIAAKREYDGAKAKGQVISITQDLRADRPERPVTGKSLLSRFDLSSRLDGNVAKPKSSFADRLGPLPDAVKRGANSRATGKQRQARNQTTRQQKQDSSANAPTPDSGSAAPSDDVQMS